MASRSLLVCLFIVVINTVYTAPANEGTNPPAFDCPNDNEMYTECELAVCYKTCSHLINPPPCPGIAFPCIRPKCVCKHDFLRNEDGVCIPVETCKEYKTQQMMFGRY